MNPLINQNGKPSSTIEAIEVLKKERAALTEQCQKNAQQLMFLKNLLTETLNKELEASERALNELHVQFIPNQNKSDSTLNQVQNMINYLKNAQMNLYRLERLSDLQRRVASPSRSL